MKYKLVWLGILVLAFAAGVAGLNLADAQDTGFAQDRPTGVLVSTEPLDLLDFTDVSVRAGQSGEVALSDTSQDKLYAAEETRGDGRKAYVFPGVNSQHMLFVRDRTPDNRAFVYVDETPGMYSFLNYTDKGDAEKVILTGEIHVNAEEDTVLYPYLVYRDGNGRVFIQDSQPNWILHRESLGLQSTLTFDETHTLHNNGEETGGSIRIELAVHAELPAEDFRVLQMNERHNVLQADSYPARDLPESIEPQAGCNYMLVETHKTDRDGNPVTERTLYSRTDEGFSVWTCEGTFCERSSISLLWQ